MDEERILRRTAFVTSAGDLSFCPAPRVCEIAIVGKSNVGKSSLINALAKNSKLARTSQQPGKTRLINYFDAGFDLSTRFYLVDLPGYGFAKASKREQQGWGELMERYLGSGRVTHLILLIDIRHDPTEHDRMMFRYLLYYGIPYTLVATKADKLTRSKRAAAANACAKALGAPPYALPVSAETGEGCAALLKRISDVVDDAVAQSLRTTVSDEEPLE